ncbi:MAG TPA: hypothetical protein VHL11_24370, partial [Phototrophicaceae bacterium]|nr:hypothetical protein [Phototrophicaceae bacterium]
MNDRKQAELLEQYLITLRHDPGATPPDDLDPIIAELARKFKQQATFRPNHDARARIWQRTLANTRRDAQFSSLAPENIWQITQITEAKTEPRRVVYPVTLSAAVMAVMLFFAAMLIFASRPPEDLDDPATTTPNQYASTGNITPTEEVETTTTALASPTDPKVTDSMPALVDRMTWINQLPSFGVRV